MYLATKPRTPWVIVFGFTNSLVIFLANFDALASEAEEHGWEKAPSFGPSCLVESES